MFLKKKQLFTERQADHESTTQKKFYRAKLGDES